MSLPPIIANSSTLALYETVSRRRDRSSPAACIIASVLAFIEDPATIALRSSVDRRRVRISPRLVQAIERVIVDPATIALRATASRRMRVARIAQRLGEASEPVALTSLIETRVRRRIGAELTAIRARIVNWDPNDARTGQIHRWIEVFTRLYHSQEEPPTSELYRIYRQLIAPVLPPPPVVEEVEEEFLQEAEELSQEISEARSDILAWDEAFHGEIVEIAASIQELTNERVSGNQEILRMIAEQVQTIQHLEADMTHLREQQVAIEASLERVRAVDATLRTEVQKTQIALQEQQSSFLSGLLSLAAITVGCYLLKQITPLRFFPIRDGAMLEVSTKI